MVTSRDVIEVCSFLPPLMKRCSQKLSAFLCPGCKYQCGRDWDLPCEYISHCQTEKFRYFHLTEKKVWKLNFCKTLGKQQNVSDLRALPGARPPPREEPSTVAIL